MANRKIGPWKREDILGYLEIKKKQSKWKMIVLTMKQESEIQLRIFDCVKQINPCLVTLL